MTISPMVPYIDWTVDRYVRYLKICGQDQNCPNVIITDSGITNLPRCDIMSVQRAVDLITNNPDLIKQGLVFERATLTTIRNCNLGTVEDEDSTYGDFTEDE